MGASAAGFDQGGARQVGESAQALGLSRANLRKLSARANDSPGPGEPLDRLPGDMVLVRNGSSMFAASQRPVSRDEYARFANATGREPARCRVSASLLRVLAPRDWTSPGFEQSAHAPVACVSWEAANAYARWLAPPPDPACAPPQSPAT